MMCCLQIISDVSKSKETRFIYYTYLFIAYEKTAESANKN